MIDQKALAALAGRILITLMLGIGASACEDLDPKNYPQLKIEDLKAGKGSSAVGTRDTIHVHYRGLFADGTEFDSSYKRGKAKRFNMRSSTLIKGWKIGIQGMRVGGKRRLVIPPDLAFGAKGKASRIPPNATLTFDIELLEIE